MRLVSGVMVPWQLCLQEATDGSRAILSNRESAAIKYIKAIFQYFHFIQLTVETQGSLFLVILIQNFILEWGIMYYRNRSIKINWQDTKVINSKNELSQRQTPDTLSIDSVRPKSGVVPSRL